MSWLKEFREFAVKGNVVDLAVAVIIGTAFGKIVSSFVADLVMPVIGALIGGIQYENLVIQIGDAKITYGKFIQNVVDFVIIALVIFLMVKMINHYRRKAARLEDAFLARLELPGAEAVLHRARQLLADRLLDARAVLRGEDRGDAEARRLVERARAEARAGAVGQAFLFAHARPDARGRGAAEQIVAQQQRGEVRMVVAHFHVLAAAQHRVRLVGGDELVFDRRTLEVLPGHALEGVRRAPGAEQLADGARQRLGVELADRGEVGAGGAHQLAVAALRVLERRLADPLEPL